MATTFDCMSMKGLRLAHLISSNKKEADAACGLRIFYAIVMLVTSGFIIMNAVMTHLV